MNRTVLLLAFVLYAGLTLGGAGLHLLEFAPEDDCRACHTAPAGASLSAPCGDGPLPCSDRNHTHHDHPVHQHEDGCVTCSALTTQQTDSEAPGAVQVETSTAAPSPATSLPTETATHRPPGRAPPAA